MRIQLLLAALVALVLTQACTGASGPRHLGTISVVSAHGTLALIQDTEMALRCGQPSAPATPSCVDAATHQTISARLASAFAKDQEVAALVKSLPADVPLPASVQESLKLIQQVVDFVLDHLPGSTQKAALVSKLGGA